MFWATALARPSQCALTKRPLRAERCRCRCFVNATESSSCHWAKKLDGSPPKHGLATKGNDHRLPADSPCIRDLSLLCNSRLSCSVSTLAVFACLNIHGCFCSVAGRPPPRQHQQDSAIRWALGALIAFIRCDRISRIWPTRQIH